VANGNSNIIPLHRGAQMAAARPVREQGRPPSSAPVLSRFDGPPRNVEVKPSLRFRAAVTVGLAIVSWAIVLGCVWLIVSGAL
jgi:hypothetical protein